MNTPPPRPPAQYHPLLATPKINAITLSQNTLTSHPSSNQSPTLANFPTTSFYISLPPSTYKLAHTHCHQTYTRSQPPKQTTYIPHATILLKLTHLHYLRNALHISCHTYTPEPIIYHYLQITYQSRIVHHNYSLQFHTRHHIFLLTKTSRCSDNNTLTLNLYPYHPHPRLILTQPSKQGTLTTTSYYSGTPATTQPLTRIPRTTTSLPTTDHTTILYLPTATQN